MTNADFLKRELDELATAAAAVLDDMTDAACARLVARLQGMLFEFLKAGDVTAVPAGDGTVRLVMAVLGKDDFLAAALRAVEDEVRHERPLLDDGCVRTSIVGQGGFSSTPNLGHKVEPARIANEREHADRVVMRFRA